MHSLHARAYREQNFPVGATFGKWKVIDNSINPAKRGVLCACACGKEAYVYCADLLNGRTSSCTSCNLKNPERKAKFRQAFQDKATCLLGQTHGKRTVIGWKHNHLQVQCECGSVSWVQRGNFLKNKAESCKSCVSYSHSKVEQEIQKALDIPLIPLKIGKFNYDLVCPMRRVIIEHDGLYWHREELIGKNKHLLCKQNAEVHGYRVIRVRSDLWETRRSQVLSYLKAALNLCTQKVAARRCAVIDLNKKDAAALLDAWHIQGGDKRALLSLGLKTTAGQLVAVAQFSKHPRNNVEWVLSRFASVPGTVVQGGLGKLSHAGLRNLETEYIVSWADLNLSQGTSYLRAGWKLDKQHPPDYVYFRGNKVFSKQSRKKSAVNTPAGMTEAEHARKNNLHRYWDCGKLRLVLTRPIS